MSDEKTPMTEEEHRAAIARIRRRADAAFQPLLIAQTKIWDEEDAAAAGEETAVPPTETCDGIDNNCDGMVDEGMNCEMTDTNPED